MNLGIDIDGTMTDFESFVLRYGEKYMWNKYRMRVINRSGCDLDEVFDIKNQLVMRGYEEKEALQMEGKILDKFWNRFYLRYIWGENFRTDVRRTVREFRRHNHKIYIITSRRFGTEKTLKGAFVRLTIRLQMIKNGVVFDHLIIAENDDEKIEKILCEKIDVMIDDKPYIANAICDKVRTFCVSAAYNREKTNSAVRTVKSLYEIIEMLNPDKN